MRALRLLNKENTVMKLNQPKFITWLIALAAGVIGLVLWFALPDNQIVAFLVELAGLALLLVANAVKGL
jgi:hypothetical protein